MPAAITGRLTHGRACAVPMLLPRRNPDDFPRPDFFDRQTRPIPHVTIHLRPGGCVCQAVRTLGSNVTLAPRTRAGSAASNSGPTRVVPVQYSAGPFPEGRDAPCGSHWCAQCVSKTLIKGWHPVCPFRRGVSNFHCPLKRLFQVLGKLFRYDRSSSRTSRNAPSRSSSEPSTAAGSLKL